jgi:hypothetical protein
MSRLKLKSITALLNNKDFFQTFQQYIQQNRLQLFYHFSRLYHGEGKIGENHNICGKNSIAFIQ